MKIFAPFYAQHWDLDEWKSLGYKNREEAEYWQRSSCGILCIKMAMDALSMESQTPSVKEFIDLGLKQGAYTERSGWSHSGLVGLINSFGFSAVAQPLKILDLKDILQKNQLAIVSVKWAFRGDKTLKERILFWKKYGGHLALVVGFEEERGELTGFYVHHTSKILEQNWENRFIPIKQFVKSFAGRGIVVSWG